MLRTLENLLPQMTVKEREEVTIFAAFLLARRTQKSFYLAPDDLSSEEIGKLAGESGSFHWLAREEEDVYVLDDGDAVQWPDES